MPTKRMVSVPQRQTSRYKGVTGLLYSTWGLVCYELPISLLFCLILSYLIASYLIYLILSHALQLLVDSGSVAWSPHVSLVYLLT